MTCNYVNDVITYVKESKYLDKSCMKSISKSVGFYWYTNAKCLIND